MPRRREVPKRRITPDPKFKDKLVTKFTNTLMFREEIDGRGHPVRGPST
jgi:ribosomal protein S7